MASETSADQVRAAVVERRAEAGVGPEVGRIAALELAPQAPLVGVRVVECDALEPALLVDEVDRAPVGEGGDEQPGDVLEGLRVVERGGQQLAGFGEELLAPLGVLGTGDVLDDIDRELGLVVEQGRLGQSQYCRPGKPSQHFAHDSGNSGT
jgi:hypothetical protein